MFVLVACRPPDFGSAASSDALVNRLKACFEFTELFRARGAGQSPNILRYVRTKVEQFKGIWREFRGPRPYSQQRRYSFIRRPFQVYGVSSLCPSFTNYGSRIRFSSHKSRRWIVCSRGNNRRNWCERRGPLSADTVEKVSGSHGRSLFVEIDSPVCVSAKLSSGMLGI